MREKRERLLRSFFFFFIFGVISEPPRAPPPPPPMHATRASTTSSFQVVVLTLLYSWAGLGIAIVNDFKSVEGDREMGLQSLPVAFGVEKAKWICVASIDATQLGIAAWLYSVGEPTYAAVLAALVLPQIFAQFKYFLPDPVGNDVK